MVFERLCQTNELELDHWINQVGEQIAKKEFTITPQAT